nr:MAG TPA: hypothetical protein [Caudoviricetes sp.]
MGYPNLIYYFLQLLSIYYLYQSFVQLYNQATIH